MGYPLVRVDKLHPDGSGRASWYGYRIPDRDGAVRIYAPPATRRIHIAGLWTPRGWLVSAFHPDWRFVPHRWVDGGTTGMYIDVVRSTAVHRDRVEYVDLYLDVSIHEGVVTEKDEELLDRLAAHEAAAVRSTRDDLRARIAGAEGPFSRTRRSGMFPKMPTGFRRSSAAVPVPGTCRARTSAAPRAGRASSGAPPLHPIIVASAGTLRSRRSGRLGRQSIPRVHRTGRRVKPLDSRSAAPA